MVGYSDVHADFISWVMGAMFFAAVAYVLFIAMVRDGQFGSRRATHVHRDPTRPEPARRLTRTERDERSAYVEAKMERLK